MAKHGGARQGAGRKKVHDEIAARDIAIQAIVSVYGSLEEGMQRLLLSTEPSLMKFVFEHALGKPAEKVIHGGDPDMPVNFITDARYKDKQENNS
jgi:hypothetical protein